MTEPNCSLIIPYVMNPLLRFFVTLNAFLIKSTGGRLGTRMGGQSVLLLYTVGRKSGKSFTTPVTYFRDGADYLVVASNWGRTQDPDWFRNLIRQPRAKIQVSDRALEVRARQAGGAEYSRLWELVTRKNPQYLRYQKTAQRQIPVVILSPLE